MDLIVQTFLFENNITITHEYIFTDIYFLELKKCYIGCSLSNDKIKMHKNRTD